MVSALLDDTCLKGLNDITRHAMLIPSLLGTAVINRTDDRFPEMPSLMTVIFLCCFVRLVSGMLSTSQSSRSPFPSQVKLTAV